MNRTFRLESVLRVRRLQERAAMAAAAQASAVAAEHMAIAQERRRQAAESVAIGTADGRTFLASMVASRAMAANAAAMREDAAMKAVLADAARTEQHSATRRVKGMERLEERHRADVQSEEDRVETAATDDLVSGRHAVSRAASREQDGGRA